jgi:Spy/CpxP family protein refolding chaperone
MNRIKIIMMMFLLTGLLAFPMMAMSQETGTGKHAQAMGMAKGQMGNSAASNLTTEQRDQISKLHVKFREDNADTLKQLMTKQFDLKTIFNSEKPDVEKAKAIQKEISDLNAKLALKRIDLYNEIRKINPNAKFGKGEGKGRGMMGRMGKMGMMGKGMGS